MRQRECALFGSLTQPNLDQLSLSDRKKISQKVRDNHIMLFIHTVFRLWGVLMRHRKQGYQVDFKSGVQCMRARCGSGVADLTHDVAEWRCHRAQEWRLACRFGLCVVVNDELGGGACDGLVSIAQECAAIAYVFRPGDEVLKHLLPLAAARRGLLRAGFDEINQALVWASARSRALILSRCLPVSSPPLPERVLFRE